MRRCQNFAPEPLDGLFGNALVKTDELRRLIARYIDQDILDRVAAEHRRGRRLFVATTNLDSQRSVIWDMGAIANSGSPAALSLFRQVLAASASIPTVFPPRLIDVEAEGRRFQEMHVDGSAIQQIFVMPDDLLLGQRQPQGSIRIKDIYVLVNGKVDPVFTVVKDSAVDVGLRSLSTILTHETHDNVLSSYAFSRQHGVGFHLAFIGADAEDSGLGAFDTNAMRKLYALGQTKGRSARPWANSPPVSSGAAASDLVAAK